MSQRGKPETAWLRSQTALGRKAAAPAIGLMLAGIVLAIIQAGCAARLLALLLRHRAGPGVVLLTVFAAASVARAAAGIAAERRAVAAGAAGCGRLRRSLLSHLVAAGPGVLRARHSGELAALAIDQIEALEGLFARWIPAAAVAVAGPVLVGLAAFTASRFAGIVLVVTGLLVPVGMAFAGIGAARASRAQFAAMSRLQTRFLDRVRGIATIVLAGRAEDEARALREAADELRARTMRVLRVAFLSSTVLDLAMACALVAVALHAARRPAAPASSLFALLLVPEFFAPLRAFAAAYADQMQARTVAVALTSLPPIPEAAPAPPMLRAIEASGVSIAFDRVSLTWDPARGPALQDVSFRVAAGETLIVAGPSGAGKSSLIELLLGFARPDHGSVTLNGMNIADIVPAALARVTAWIGQRPLIFAGTLRENIRFGREDATDAEIAEAVAKARLGAVIAALPQGLETRIGEGGFGLSGGQAQRVAIARAFLRNAPLLLLDEPTAHLDPATEAEVLESLKRLAAGRTVLLVTHSAAAQAFPGRRLDLRAGRVVGAMARGAA